MFGRSRFLLSAAALFALVCLAAQAQAPRKNGGPKYDATTEVTLKAVVDDLKDFECPVTGTVGSHIEIHTTDGATFEVHLAPAAFMQEFGIVINKGDQVEVIGSKVPLNGGTAILARQVNSNNYMYTFRNDKGRPLW